MIYSIQYLRAIAAILVAAFHVTISLKSELASFPVFEAGQAGVDIFFVISGFIMWQTTRKAGLGPYEFSRRRLVRIVPLYWLATLTMFAMPSISGTIAGATRQNADHLLASLFFIPAPYPADTSHWFPVYVPGWTINYEIFFYAIFAAALFIRSPSFRAWSLIAALTCIVLAGTHSHTGGLFKWYSNPILLEFAAGVVIGIWYTSGRRFLGIPATAALLAIATATLLLPQAFSTRAISWGLPACFIVFGALSLEKSGHITRLAIPKFLGDASYALYLTHIFSIGAVAVFWTRVGIWPSWPGQIAFFIVAMAASLVIAALTHILVEKPLNRLADRLTRPRERSQSGLVKARMPAAE